VVQTAGLPLPLPSSPTVTHSFPDTHEISCTSPLGASAPGIGCSFHAPLFVDVQATESPLLFVPTVTHGPLVLQEMATGPPFDCVELLVSGTDCVVYVAPPSIVVHDAPFP
jgi:hypothetical protein